MIAAVLTIDFQICISKTLIIVINSTDSTIDELAVRVLC